MAIRLIARRTFRFPFRSGARQVCVGEVFEAEPVEAAALVNFHGHAIFAENAASASPSAEPPRRRYRRRDLSAEEE